MPITLKSIGDFSQSVSFERKVLLEEVTSVIRQTNVAEESR